MAIKKPTKQLIAPFDELNTKLWWSYRDITPEEITTINTFLQTNIKDLQIIPDLYENMKYLSKTLGLYHHPFLNYPIKKPIKPSDTANPIIGVSPDIQTQPQAQILPQTQTKPGQPNTVANQQQQSSQQPSQIQEQSIESTLIQITNQKIDSITLRLLMHCWPTSKFECLKIGNNSFDSLSEKVLLDLVTTPTIKITKFFNDWNPPRSLDFCTKIATSPCIEFLSLRCDNLDDNQIKQLSDGLKTNNMLKFLDLYGNHISQKGVEALAELLNQSGPLEYLGLAKNLLSRPEEMASFFKVIGRFPLTQQEAEAHQKKEKEREATIVKNQKMKNKKGYVEEPIPILDPIQQLEDESWILLKNNKISLINLALNGFDDESLTAFTRFLSNTGDHFTLVLAENKIQESSKSDIRAKFNNRIII